MSEFLPFSRPDIGEEEIAAVVETMRSGWLTTGPQTRKFETAVAEFLGDGVQAIAVNSATAGLHLALEAIGIGPGDEVIVPAHTFTATAEVVRYLGAHPVLVDCHPDTLNIDPGLVERAVTERTKAMIPVHFGGLACDMAALQAIARRRDLHIVEDAAHAIPTTSGNRLIGALDTAAAVYSFYATKTLVTGEGGMVLTRDPDLARRARTMRLHGISRDVFDRFTSTKPAWHYEVVAPGFKYNMTDIAAAIGIEQLRKLWPQHERRSEVVRRYDAAFADLPLGLPAHAPAGETHSWHLYVIRLADDAPLRRDAFIQAMADRGIGCSVHYIPLHLHPYWRDTYGLRPEMFPVSTDVFSRALSLPLFSKMSDADVDRVIATVRELLSARGTATARVAASAAAR